MKRWTYLIPRLVIIVLMVVAIWFGKDPLIRYAIIHQTQRLTGAKVEIGQLRTTLENGKVFLKDIKFADPRDPMKNFLQADIAYLKIDLARLWHRQIVIDEGQTTRLVFQAPRTESGRLAAIPKIGKVASPQTTGSNVDFEVEQIGQAWLDQIKIDPAPTISDDFEIVRLIQEKDKWQPRIQEYTDKIQTLRPELDRLRRSLETGIQNSLRDPVRFQSVANELQLLEQQAASIRLELDQQLQLVVAAKQELLATQSRDLQRIQQQTMSNPFDSELVSSLLLRRAQTEMVAEVVDCFRAFQNSIPQLHENPNGRQPSIAAGHGVDVNFTGTIPQPDFLIRQLELEGEGRFANQHLNFVGTARNLSTQPMRHDQPTTFDLRAQGNQHVIVHCELDRRQDQPSDRLRIRCPDLEFPAQSLGDARSLQVALGPASRVNAEIELELVGEELTGTLKFDHSNVALHVDNLNDLAGGADTALRINQGLIEVDQFKSQMSIAGTLDDYTIEMDCDLGTRFAATVDRVVLGHFRQQIEQQKLRLKELTAAELQNLDRIIQPELERIASDLSQEVTEIANLKQLIQAPNHQPWPKLR